MKILINTPHLQESGGVANHFKGLKEYWTQEVHYNYIASRYGIQGRFLLPFDILKFIFKCIFFRFHIVLLNPSLAYTAIKRDKLYLIISKFFGKKTIVFFHGWNEQLARKISIDPSQFISNFNKADEILVLASDYKKQLRNWGIYKPIILTSTKVDDSLLMKNGKTTKENNWTILFLARIEANKGIFTAIEAYQIIKKKNSDSRLVVAGSGSALIAAKKMVEKLKIEDVEFLGNIKGNKLKSAFESSNIYILPTFHGEGMPTSVLEAMAFGLPVITRPVGGLVDFFENGKMGFMIESLEAEDFAEKVIELLKNQKKMKKIGNYNQSYAREFFLASKVALQLESRFHKIMQIRNENKNNGKF